ncbi:Uncharacterised protein [BD1-7 clade bacterium]|uniref:CopZ zinc binding domain-containing protein n=1 Tax=BD1-7 clade bacterium TaxID=2029982 RepID=A0A5S9Q9S8_9GAMM|nr:Uncharacterised protein [BD1-7 clade bacterium]CAA0114831.1 Uncharacterised protein [BD1-7 clade bacterium]
MMATASEVTLNIGDTHLCPSCHCEGQTVREVTIRHHVKFPLNQQRFSDTPYFYCLNDTCNTSYFSVDRVFQIGDLQSEEQIKNKTVCYCFGITEEAFHAYIARDQQAAFFDDLDALAYSTQCFCKAKNPAGRGCLKTFTQMALTALSEGNTLKKR